MRFHTGSTTPRKTILSAELDFGHRSSSLTWRQDSTFLPLPRCKPLAVQVTHPRQRIPYIPECTSWDRISTPSGRFSEFLPEEMRRYNESISNVARTAIAWSSRYYSNEESADLLITTRRIVDLSRTEVEQHLSDAIKKGGQFHRNAMMRLNLLAQVIHQTPRYHLLYRELEQLLRYRKIVAHMGAKIGFIKIKASREAIEGKRHADSVYIRKLHHDVKALQRHLDDDRSTIPFLLRDGSRAIAIPFGVDTHPIMFVFSKTSTGKYNLSIFNQGLQPTSNPLITGSDEVEVLTTPYTQTHVQIKDIDPKYLFAFKLFEVLIQQRCLTTGSLDRVYETVHDFAVIQGRGTVQSCPYEDQVIKAKRLVRFANTVRNIQALQKAEQDFVAKTEFYSCPMQIGACYEANAAAAENFIVSSRTNKLLQMYSLRTLVCSLRDRSLGKEDRTSLLLLEERYDACRLSLRA